MLADCGEIRDEVANLLAAGIDLVVGKLSPVFDSILEKAMGLSGAAFGEFFMVEEERFQLVGTRGVPPALTEFRKHFPLFYQPGGNTAQLRAGADHVHIVDILE